MNFLFKFWVNYPYFQNLILHCKKRLAIFPSPAGMSLTKLSLGGNNQIIPAQDEFGQWNDILAGGGEMAYPFLQCSIMAHVKYNELC